MTLSLTALGLVALLTAPAPEPALKCGDSAVLSEEGRRIMAEGVVDAENPIIVVDDQVRMEPGATRDLDSEEIESVQVACWDPGVGAFQSGAGLPVVRIMTRTGWENRPDTEDARAAAQAAVVARWFREKYGA